MSTVNYRSELHPNAPITDELGLVRVCVGCGCTDADACVEEESGRTCSWVDGTGIDICSFCVAIARAMGFIE